MSDEAKPKATRAKPAAAGAGRVARPARAKVVAGAAPAAAKPRAPAAAKAAVSPAPEAVAGPAAGGTTVRKKELIERVVAASGAKKKLVKDVVEATLKVLGDALASDETLAIPPFGKAKVNKHRGMAKGEMLVVKLRRPGEGDGGGKARAKAANDALAETGE
ncbi:MAG: hypothetical protein RLZZ528_223 [Pseudomonadota bacterium]